MEIIERRRREQATRRVWVEKENRRMEIYATLNGRWDQGSADEIIKLVSELLEDQMDGG